VVSHKIFPYEKPHPFKDFMNMTLNVVELKINRTEHNYRVGQKSKTLLVFTKPYYCVPIKLVFVRYECKSQGNTHECNIYNCSAVAELGDRLATTDFGRKDGVLCPLRGSWVPI